MAHGRYGKELDIYALGVDPLLSTPGLRAVRRRERGAKVLMKHLTGPARRIEICRAPPGGPGFGEGSFPVITAGENAAARQAFEPDLTYVRLGKA